MSDEPSPVRDPDPYADNDTIFGRVLRREIPADIVWDDEHCLAFRDIQPQAPCHVLVIPKRHLAALHDADVEDRTLLGHLLFVAAEIARGEGIAGDGYRVVVNDGARANQTVFHLHVHLLGGRDFDWPPG